MASSNRHWVEDLFPPVYTLTIEDLLEDGEEKPASVYELAAKRISKFDPERIKNVFERVWLMKTIEEQQKQLAETTLDESVVNGNESTLQYTKQSQNLSVLNQGSTQNRLEQIILQALREGQDKWQGEEVDVQDSDLWSSSEIKEIRKVYSAARKENTKLRAALEEAESRIKQLERKNKQQFAMFAGKEDALLDAQKANKRLQILSKTLKTNLDQAEKDNDDLGDEIEELKVKNSELIQELSEITKVVDSERIQRQNAEIDLEEIRKETLRDAEIQIERLEIRYENKIHKLEKDIDEVNIALGKERKDHHRTKKGLEHLQTHFASLPYKDSEARKTMVATDQLTTWTVS